MSNIAIKTTVALTSAATVTQPRRASHFTWSAVSKHDGLLHQLFTSFTVQGMKWGLAHFYSLKYHEKWKVWNNGSKNSIFSVVAGIIFIHWGGNCLVLPFLIETKHLLLENLSSHQCVTLQMGLVRSSEAGGRGNRWRGCICRVGAGACWQIPRYRSDTKASGHIHPNWSPQSSKWGCSTWAEEKTAGWGLNVVTKMHVMQDRVPDRCPIYYLR